MENGSDTNPGAPSGLDQLLREAELRKTKAEAASIETENRWYILKYILQAVLAAILAIPIIWFYATEVAVPLFNAENAQLRRDNEYVRDSLDQVEEQFSQQMALLIVDKEEIAEEYKTLDSLHALLSRKYRQMSSQLSFTQAQRAAAQAQLDSVQNALKRSVITKFALITGWNIVIFNGEKPISAIEAFKPIEGDLIMVQDLEGNSYIPDFGINNIGQVKPGKGYGVYVERPTTLTFNKRE